MSSEQQDRLFGFLIHQLDVNGLNTERAWEIIAGNSFGSLEETIAALKFILLYPSAKNTTKVYAKALLTKFYDEGTNIYESRFDLNILS